MNAQEMTVTETIAGDAPARIRWSSEEQTALLARIAEKLADAGFAPESWMAFEHREQLEELFLQAQQEVTPHKVKKRSDQHFSQRYYVLMPKIGPMLKSMLAERLSIVARNGASVEAAMNGSHAPVPIIPEPDPLGEITAFPQSPGAEPPPPVPYPSHLIKVEVALVASERAELDQLREEMQMVIDENKQIRDRLLQIDQQLADITANPANAQHTKLRRIAFVGRHREQFLKIKRELGNTDLPISFFFIDCDKNPSQVFADYAICTTECSHKWTGKVIDSIGKDRFHMGNTSAERCRDIIKMWLMSET